MVSETHDNVDLVLGVKNLTALEAELSMRNLKFKILNKSFPMFPVDKEIIKLKEGRFLKVEALVSDQISGLGIIKFQD